MHRFNRLIKIKNHPNHQRKQTGIINTEDDVPFNMTGRMGGLDRTCHKRTGQGFVILLFFFKRKTSCCFSLVSNHFLDVFTSM